jgi:Tol biopolymer transport system component/DNA-binding winged helix-turn-helix (wHTH) protein
MLYRNGEVVSLTPKVVETLVALVERSGEVVSKDELIERLWADTAVEESNLSQNLYILRKTLGNRADGKPLIETFRRRGYRFNGEVRDAGTVEPFVATHNKTVTATRFEVLESGLGAVASKKLFYLSIAGAIAVGLALFFALRFFQFVSKTGKDSTITLGIKMTRLTPDQNVSSAAISPDGKYLVYDLTEHGKHSLWLKDISSGSATQIMPIDDGRYFDLQFSPDGTQIYYGRALNNHPNMTVFRIPAFGGETQLVAFNRISPLTVSPDGSQIAFIRNVEDEDRLIVADADGSKERTLSRRTKTSKYESWGSNLSWSPDGSRIAICGSELVGEKWRHELIEVSAKDGSERIIPTPVWNYIDDVAWEADQRSLLVRARETEVSPWQIWRISYPDGKANRVTDDINNYDDLSLSADSRFLVVSQRLGNFNIWVMPTHEPNRAKQLTFGAAVSANDGVFGIAVLPEGRIVYTSPRGGNVDLWQMESDGSGQKQLTKNAGDFNGQPRAAPDGKSIVFVSSRSGSLQIWRMDADGGNQRQLTFGEAADQPWISPDGAWIYFSLHEFEKQLIAKIPFDGGESVKAFEQHNPYHPSISPSGEFMYFDCYDENSDQPWKHGVLSLESGKILKEFGFSEGGFMEGWADSVSAIVERDDRRNLWVQPIYGGKSRPLTDFDSGQIRNFAVSPDFKKIVLARGNPSAEAILITNF